MDIIITNKTNEDGVVFLIGITTALYIGNINMVNNPNYECSGNIVDHKYSCVPSENNKHTFFFSLAKEAAVTLNLHSGDSLVSGVAWFAPNSSNVDLVSAGNSKQSIAEFTLSTVVSVDISMVQGISSGVKMNYVNAAGTKLIDIAAVPKQPCNFNQTGWLTSTTPDDVKFLTILSDFYTASETEMYSCAGQEYSKQSLARCAGALADESACGQHCCRKYIESTYETNGTFCDWLDHNDAQAYCWTLDEFKCTDNRCGYATEADPYDNWPTDCSIFVPTNTYATNVYSCGKNKNAPGPDSKTYWSEVGCIDKEVNGEPTNPNVKRNDGVFTIEFVDLPWMRNPGPIVDCTVRPIKPTQPQPDHTTTPTPTLQSTHNTNLWLVVGLPVAIVIVILTAILVWYFIKKH